MGNSSKDGVGIVLVPRDAHETNGTLLFTDDNVKVLLPLGKPSINIGNHFWLMSLEIQSLALDISTLWLLNEE